jgi:hypothetical protein
MLANPDAFQRFKSRIHTSHVANCRHTRAGQALSSGSVVLDNSTSSTLDGEDTSDLEDNVCISC